MKAGSLNHRITVQQQSTGQDELGQPVSTWTTFKTLWADVRHLNGLEALKSDAPVSTVKASIRIRSTSGVNAGMRVLQGSTVYQINAVMPNQVQGFIDLACEVVQ